MTECDESDEFCPRYVLIRNNCKSRCDNHYVIPADTPESKGKLVIEFEQERGHEHKMFKDDREEDRENVLE